jgi:ankyrin repeat protein
MAGLPDSALRAAHSAIHLQRYFTDLSPETLPSIREHLFGFSVFRDSDRMEEFVSTLLCFVEVRPQKCDLYCSVLLDYAATHPSVLSNLKSLLLHRFFSYCRLPLTYPKQLRYSYFAFLLLERGFLTADDICEGLHFYEVLALEAEGFAVHFSWFAPEIEARRPDWFRAKVKQSLAQNDRWFIPSIFNDAKVDFKDFRENNWALLRKVRRAGWAPDAVCSAISRDDVPGLESLSFKLNNRLPASVFEPFWMLRDRPTPVQYAAAKGSVLCFRFLVDRGADLAKLDGIGRGIAEFAIFGGCIPIIQALKSDRRCDFSYGVYYAILYHRPAIVDWLRTPESQELHSFLTNSAISDNVETFLMGLSYGASVNAIDSDGLTALDYAIDRLSLHCFGLLLAHPEIKMPTDVAEKALLSGSPYVFARASMFDRGGIAPCVLFSAAEQDFSEVLGVLFTKHREDPFLDFNLNTGPILHCAACFDNANVARIFLAQPDADPNMRNSVGQTPLMLAIVKRSFRVAKVLIADPRTNVNAITDGRSILEKAIVMGLSNIVEMLVNRLDLKVNGSKAGDRPLHLAIDQDDVRICRLLLKHPNIDPNLDGALCIAVEKGQFEMVEVLLGDPRTDLSVRAGLMRTVLHLAVARSDDRITELIVKDSRIDVNAQDIAVRFRDKEKPRCIMHHHRRARLCLIY